MLRHLPLIQSRHALTVGFGLLLALMLGATVGGLMRVQAVNRSLDTQQAKADLIASLINVSRQCTEVVYALAAEGGQARTNWAERRLQRLWLEWGDVTRKLEAMNMTESERIAFEEARLCDLLSEAIEANSNPNRLTRTYSIAPKNASTTIKCQSCTTAGMWTARQEKK